MHRISLISVGKPKSPWIIEGCGVFVDRIEHQCDFSERVLTSGDLREENDRVLSAIEKVQGIVVALADTGRQFSSREFAVWIQGQKDRGNPIIFIIGGAYGLDERVLAKADMILSLSRMTLPHELCKLVFLEQLYRAHTIIAGQQYHH
jgi:23S rRNA (pseudouridine1915-N3)-methyltransferase